MMSLDTLPRGKTARIVKFEGDMPFRKRLYSFGLEPKCEITVKEQSIAKQNIEIKCRDSLIALRLDEAKKIMVEEII